MKRILNCITKVLYSSWMDLALGLVLLIVSVKGFQIAHEINQVSENFSGSILYVLIIGFLGIISFLLSVYFLLKSSSFFDHSYHLIESDKADS